MNTRVLLSLLATFFIFDASNAAPARRTNTRATSAPTNTASTAPATTTARAARSARSATPAATTTGGSRTMSARSARPVTTTTSQPKTLSARAGTTQKVISTGTKVSTASQNTLVDKSCQEKYNGCMDAFCMLENSNGGRCTCSDKVIDLNKALAEIERVDELSYRMATIGIEQLEMGADADAAIAMAQNVAEKLKNPQSAQHQGRSLDFSAFETPVDFTEDIFKSSSSDPNSLDDKTGNELYNAVSNMCKQQIPECSASIKPIELLYSQQIKSDCLAYENTIKKKRNESNEKLLAAERALQETALEQQQTANKYDLSKCTIKFRECMQTTAGCGEDFSGCATVVATDNTGARNNMLGKTKKYKIKGAVSEIEIAAATYDTLFAKKPLCESVTKQCVAVADQVWDTFIRESANQIKSAEIIAEDNARQNCISDISACFQKACRDNMDPNDPDGSYDMCLTRPETMFNVCRIPLNACGIDATKKSTAEKSEIWNHIAASLASQRVDACTTQIKQCLQSDDRCGSDYSQCVGLDLDTIVKMCPLEKVVACNSSEYGDNPKEIEDYIYSVATGVFNNIDNSLQKTCQNAALTKMMEICGDTTTCYLADKNSTLGIGSLQTAQDTDNNYVISGIIDFNNFKLNKKPEPTFTDYQDGKVYTVEYTVKSSGQTKTRIDNVINDFTQELNRKISLLTQDPTINMCITGRDVSQIVRGRTRTERTAARYPEMLNSYIDVIYDSLLATARQNYLVAYAKEMSEANSASREYRNMLMCYGLADLTTAMSDEKASFKPNTSSRYGIIAQGDDYIKLSGVSNEDIFKLQQAGANDTTTHRDASGLIIATEDISAVYEPGPQVCRLTSRLYACKGYEAIYEGHSKSTSVGVTGGVELSGGANVAGGIAGANGKIGASGGVSVGTSSSSTTHSGTFCNSFAEPLISEQIISFKSGEAVFGNVDRGNMESTYYNSSQTNTYTDNSWGIDASLSLSFDQSTHETNYGVEEGEIQYSNSMEQTACANKGENFTWTGSECRELTDAEKTQKRLKKSDCTGSTPILDRQTNKCRAITAEDCTRNETFEGGKCVKKSETAQGKLEQAKKECTKKAKDGYEWREDQCVPSAELQKCQSNAGEWKNGKCTQATVSKKQQCEQQTNSTYKWINGRCIDMTEAEQQCKLANKGFNQNTGKCK